MSRLLEKIHSYHEGLSPSKVARKYEYLTENAFRFFRGTNDLFYEDLSKTSLSPSPETWVCGDLHIENFGSYKGDNRLVYFDINDFDESVLAPVAWELVRMVTSILVAFEAFHITDKEAIAAAHVFLKKYAETLSEGKSKYIESKIANGIVRKFLNKVKARNAEQLLKGKICIRDNKLQLHHHKRKYLKIDEDLKKNLVDVFNEWMQSNNQPPNDYKVLDARFRLAGTGSIGIHRYVFLIEKNNDPCKHRLIDMKEALASSLTPFVKIKQPPWQSEADRIIYIQKMLQNVSPAQLSHLHFDNANYVLQELQPSKDRVNFKLIDDNFKVLCCVIEDMAMLTASAHLRGTGRKGSCTADSLIDFSNEVHWKKELLDYAINYKERVLADYQKFCTELNQ